MAVREAEPVGSLKEIREAGLDREDLLGMYRNMLLTRGIEERGHILYKQGKIPGSFYTGRGNEAASVAVATAMGPNDVGTPIQRDMGVHVTRGIEPWRILAQYMGRVDGPTRGRDGNVHMGDAVLGLHPMVSHLPAMLPVAVGMASRSASARSSAWPSPGAARARRRGMPTSDPAASAGCRWLSSTTTSGRTRRLPTSPTRSSTCRPRRCLRLRGRRRGRHRRATVYRETKVAIEEREGGGPTLIESPTLRMEGHAVHDDASYVPKELFRGQARSDRALPTNCANAELVKRRRARFRRRQDPERRRVAADESPGPTPRLGRRASSPPRSSRRHTTSNGREDVPPGDQRWAPAGDAPRPTGVRAR